MWATICWALFLFLFTIVYSCECSTCFTRWAGLSLSVYLTLGAVPIVAGLAGSGLALAGREGATGKGRGGMTTSFNVPPSSSPGAPASTPALTCWRLT